MEQTKILENKNIIRHNCHKIICENRNNICITGVEKADNASPTQFSCVVMGRNLEICGKELTVKKLDVNEGIVELAGEIDEIKYAHEKKSLIKRLFK